MRGMRANRLVVYLRAVDCWRAFTLEARREKQLVLALGTLSLLRSVRAWRHMTKVRARRVVLAVAAGSHPSTCLRLRAHSSAVSCVRRAQARLAMQRLYLRRGLVGWYQRVLWLQTQRQKLRDVAQVRREKLGQQALARTASGPSRAMAQGTRR